MKPVTIYTATYCGFCKRAKSFLEQKGVKYEEVDVTSDDAERARLVERTGRMTVPQIFIGDHGIGGYSDMVQLENEGKLDGLLQ